MNGVQDSMDIARQRLEAADTFINMDRSQPSGQAINAIFDAVCHMHEVLERLLEARKP